MNAITTTKPEPDWDIKQAILDAMDEAIVSTKNTPDDLIATLARRGLIIVELHKFDFVLTTLQLMRSAAELAAAKMGA